MVPKIDSYAFGCVVIYGWWREDGHRLEKEDLYEVMQAGHEALVEGSTGRAGGFCRGKVRPE